MLRCIEAHVVPSFGEIPVGSLWADDSPYVTDDALFVDVFDDRYPDVSDADIILEED